MTASTRTTAPAPLPPRPGRLRGIVHDRFGGLPGRFWIIAGGTIANRIGGMVIPFLVFFLGGKGVSTAQTGTIVVALGIGGAGGAVLGGWATDRLGPRTALLTGLVSAPAALGVLYAAPTVPAMTVAALLVGATAKLYPPAASALIADAVTGPTRTRAFALMHWAFNIGAAGAAATAGFLAARGFGLLFAVDAATCLAFALIAAVGIPRTARPPRARTARQAHGYGILLRDKLFLGFLALAFAQDTVYGLTEYAIPLSVRLAGLSAAVFGVAAVVNAVLVIVLQPVIYPLVARRDRLTVLAAGWIVVAAGVALTGLATRPWHFAATTVVWSAGEVLLGIVGGGIVADLAPPGAQGRYQGAFVWMSALARMSAPAVTTLLFGTVGAGWLWWGTAFTGVLGAGILIRSGPRLRARMALVSPPAR